MIALEGVAKRYGETVALHGIDVAMAAGHVHTILGENGSGKSTLVKLLSGVVQPDRGTIRLDGQAEALDAARRLERYRTVCLGGDAAAVQLMDAVCGGGLTVQAYLGTTDSRAVLEAVTVLRMGGRLVGAGLH